MLVMPFNPGTIRMIKPLCYQFKAIKPQEFRDIFLKTCYFVDFMHIMLAEFILIFFNPETLFN